MSSLTADHYFCCAGGVPGCFEGVPGYYGMLQGCSGVVPGCFKGVPGVFRGCSGDVPGCSGGVLGVFRVLQTPLSMSCKAIDWMAIIHSIISRGKSGCQEL